MQAPFAFCALRAPFIGKIAALFAIPLLIASLAAQAGWGRYQNARFGFVIPVPPGLQGGREPDNGGGQAWSSADGRINLVAWGSFNVDQMSDITPRYGEELSVPERKFTYKQRSDSWFVVSGIEEDGTHFYIRHDADANHAAGWQITYPASADAQVSAWIETIAKGWQARLGKGADRIE